MQISFRLPDSNFEKLFDVTVLNNYYQNNISNDFVISPDFYTSELLEDFGIVLIEKAGGFTATVNRKKTQKYQASHSRR